MDSRQAWQAGWYPDPTGRPAWRWWDGVCWTTERRPFPLPTAGPGHAAPAWSLLPDEHQADHFAKRVADYETVSGWLWIGLATLQILSLYAAIAGIWNLFAGFSRIRASKSIVARARHVPDDFKGVGQLIVIAVLNILLGGVIGIAFVALDFYVRDQVLKNRHVFDRDVKGAGVRPAPASEAPVTNGHSRFDPIM